MELLPLCISTHSWLIFLLIFPINTSTFTAALCFRIHCSVLARTQTSNNVAEGVCKLSMLSKEKLTEGAKIKGRRCFLGLLPAGTRPRPLLLLLQPYMERPVFSHAALQRVLRTEVRVGVRRSTSAFPAPHSRTWFCTLSTLISLKGTVQLCLGTFPSFVTDCALRWWCRDSHQIHNPTTLKYACGQHAC